MANDFRLLNEAYQKLDEAQVGDVRPLERDFEDNQLPHMLDLVNKLRVNQGVGFYERQSGMNGGISVEVRQVSFDETIWRISGWGDMDEKPWETESQEEVDGFVIDNCLQNPDLFKFYELYPVHSDQGIPLKTSFHNPYDEPEDIEPYGPDPGPRMQDLQ
jgi:hypothetical protein